MSKDEIIELRAEIKDLMTAITNVNDRIQAWTQADYEWKKQEVTKRQEFENKVKPMLDFYEDFTRTKKVILWIMGGASAILGFYLLIFEVIKTLWTK